MSKTGTGADRRQFGRRETNLHGWITVPGRPRLACTILDISVGGALIGLQKPSWLPYNFQLTVEATRFVSWCEVRHQRPDAVGVRFLTAVEAATLAPRGAVDGRSVSDQEAWTGNCR